MISILDYGAIPDGKTNNQYAIQKAIDTCYEHHGGKVLVPAGHFKTGSIILKSHVHLFLARGAILEGIDKINEYMHFSALASKSLNLDATPTWENCEYTGRPSQFFIYANNEDDIEISGEGIIDGNEAIFYGNRHEGFIEGSYYPRIPLIFFEHVTNLKIKDITFQKSGFWTIHIVGCEHVLIDGIRILNNLELANCDGIDPDHCKHVEIKNCHIEAADDAIVFKNTEGAAMYGACEDIHVHDCELITTSAGIKFGTESVSDFHHMYIHDIVIKKASRGISFQLRDGGNIQNIRFENIDIEVERHKPGLWWGTGEPIFISAVKRHEDDIVGEINNVSFTNINMVGENGVVIYCDCPDQIRNIAFNRCHLQLKNISPYPKVGLDLRPAVAPEILKEEAHVFKVKHAKNIKVKDFFYKIDDDMKSAITADFDVTLTKNFELDM